MSDELFTCHSRCATCAYRPGTEASKCERTLVKAKLCLISGELFLCHEDPARIAICRGWHDAFAARLRAGKLEEDPKLREMAEKLSDAICEAEQAVLESQHGLAKQLYDAAVAKMEAHG
jgi:hypothetical protein